jgi:cytosine/adenosine deaminase-related metal-dependent hydrolase
MPALTVEALTYAPTVFMHCQHCEVTFQEVGLGRHVHREQLREGLPDDLQVQFAELSDWLHELLTRYGRQIDVKVIDVASMLGVWKSLRHGIRTYPAVIIGGESTHVGEDLAVAELEIERRLGAHT